jgi:hypothetical protein
LGGADAGLGISAALPVIAVGSQNDWSHELHPTKFVQSLPGLIRSCIELSFNRNAFADLRRAAADLNDQRALQFRVALNRVFAAPNDISAIVVAPKVICNSRAADGNRLTDVVEYLAEFGTVYVHVAETLTEAEQQAFACVPLPGTKVISASASPRRSDNSLLSASLAGLAASVPAGLIWVACASDPDLACLAATGSNIVFDMSVLRSSTALVAARIPAERCFIAHYPGGLPWDTARLQVAYEFQMPLPFFRHVRADMHETWRDPCQARGVWILSDDTEWSVLREVAYEPTLKQFLLEATVVVNRHTGFLDGPSNRLMLSDLSADLREFGARPLACIDLCETNPEFTFVREIMLRFDVPLIPISSLREKRLMRSGHRREPVPPRHVLQEEADLAFAPTSTMFENDAGWCTLRRLVEVNKPC